LVIVENMIASVLQAGRRSLSLAHRGRLRAGLIAVTLVCIACAVAIDKPVALFLHSWLDEDMRAIFHLTSKIGEGYVWYGGGLAALLAAWLGRRRCRLATVEALWERIHYAALFFLGANLLASLTVPLIKLVIGRQRPRFLFKEGLYGFSPFTFRFGDVCFPSGHTQTIVTAMVALAFILPDRRVILPMAGLALLVGASRILVGAHYVGDVLMGAYVGAAAAVLVHRLFVRRGWSVRLIG